MNILERLKKGTSKLTITKLSYNAPAYVRAREQEIELMGIIEQQSKYAELGRLAVEIVDKDFGCNRIFDDNCFPGICNWYLFCQKRAELLAGEKYD